MSVITLEGTLHNGQIRLEGDVRPPENAKVYVVIPQTDGTQIVRIVTPRLARGEQIKDFQMDVGDEDPSRHRWLAASVDEP